MSEIPEDIMSAARGVMDGLPVDWSPANDDESAELVARAILAERERCLAFCEEYLANVELTGGTIKRFKLDDVNRIAKRAVRYVRDHINGTFDENWRPAPEGAA